MPAEPGERHPAGGRARRAHPKSCHERALGLLAVRPRSRRELERRLLGAGFDAAEVEEVLGRLERVGLVNDEEFARRFSEHQFDSRRAGTRAVVSSLAAKGVSRDVIERAVEGAGEEEDARAEELARSRVSRMGSLPTERAFTRLVSFLVRRGYPHQVARAAARRALAIDAPEDAT